jgi:SUMO ligase MMS21 Smc5/6 complex component
MSIQQVPFEINSMNIISKWKYSCKNEECICSRNLQAPTKCELTSKKITNDIIIGKCGHGFHKKCIEEFIKSYNVCPIDKLPFEEHFNSVKNNKSTFYKA